MAKNSTGLAPCPLCASDDAHLIIRLPQLRIVFADEADHPCFVRLIWQRHHTELSQLSAAERGQLLEAANQVECSMIAVLKPDKINHASFGNLVAHLHWHIVPRWQDDPHWPGPVWASRFDDRVKQGAAQRGALAAEIVRRCSLAQSQ